MKLLLERFHGGLTCTLGKLFVDDEFICFVLEDVVRETSEPVESWKIKGHTAIPRGTYTVKLTWSNRFQHFMAQLMDVPGFEGIRIHTGNTDANTEGCLIVGREIGPEHESVLKSKLAYDDLLAKLNPAFQSGEHVTIEVKNA